MKITLGQKAIVTAVVEKHYFPIGSRVVNVGKINVTEGEYYNFEDSSGLCQYLREDEFRPLNSKGKI